MAGSDDDPEGTGGGGDPGGDGAGGEPDPADAGDGEEGAGGDGGGDPGDGDEGTAPPPPAKGKAKGGAEGDGLPEALTAGLTRLGEQISGQLEEHTTGIRGEMAALERKFNDRIELSEARYGRGAAGGGPGGAGGSSPGTQQAKAGRSWVQKLFW